MKAHDLLVRLTESPAPMAPPKPGVKPSTAPTRPEEPRRRKFPNPWKKPNIQPGEEPRPKACREADARLVKPPVCEDEPPADLGAEPESLDRFMRIMQQRFMKMAVEQGKSPEEAQCIWARKSPAIAQIIGSDASMSATAGVRRVPNQFSI